MKAAIIFTAVLMSTLMVSTVSTFELKGFYVDGVSDISVRNGYRMNHPLKIFRRARVNSKYILFNRKVR